MNIIIIEQNKVFRESLKTALDQIPDFKVVLDTDNDSYSETFNKEDIQLTLIDSFLGKSKCSRIIISIRNLWPSMKFLIMINYKEECENNGNNNIGYIFKNSTKKEYEDKIRELQLNEKVNY